jgi:transcriptional regulator with XRE-family HTH domain
MSDDLGERFTMARKARGLTLEEAAAATKIRKEYLAGMESNNYELGLPDIYIRGFVKIYAKYLKMDVEAVMADCPMAEFEVLNSRLNKKFSYNAIVNGEKNAEDESDGGINYSIPPSKRLRALTDSCRRLLARAKGFYGKGRSMKIIVAISLAALLALAAVTVFRAGKNHGEISKASVDGVLGTAEQSSLSLIATGKVRVVVREKKTGHRIFTDVLEAGTVKKISHATPIQIFYDGGEFLLIKRANGEQIYPQPGRGGLEIK